MLPGSSTSRVPSGRRTMPWKRIRSTAAASAASFTTSAPPSMVVMFLLGWKLNDTRSPVEPTSRPRSARADRERRVLHHAHAVALREPGERVGCDGCVVVRGQQHARARRDRRVGRGEVDVARGEVHVDEHGRGPRALDHVGGGEEALRRRDHLVAGAHAIELQRELHRGGGRGERAHRPPAEALRERLLERGHARAGHDPAAAQRVGDGGDHGLVDGGTRERQEVGLHERATRNTPTMMNAMPTSFCAPSDSPKSHHAAIAFTT